MGQEKRIDHLVRAMRIDEIPLLEKHIAEKRIQDQKDWEREESERVKNAQEDHASALTTKNRFVRMEADKEAFLDKLFGNRHAEHEARIAEFEKHLALVKAGEVEEGEKIEKDLAEATEMGGGDGGGEEEYEEE